MEFAVELQACAGCVEAFAHDVAGGEALVVFFEGIEGCFQRVGYARDVFEFFWF